jgi:hypothetical protein
VLILGHDFGSPLVHAIRLQRRSALEPNSHRKQLVHRGWILILSAPGACSTRRSARNASNHGSLRLRPASAIYRLRRDYVRFPAPVADADHADHVPYYGDRLCRLAHREEAEVRAEIGPAWDEYAARTPGFIPRLWSPGRKLSGSPAALIFKEVYPCFTERYGWLCVLGGEVAYVVCMRAVIYRFVRRVGQNSTRRCSKRFLDSAGQPWSMVLGAIYVFGFAWMFGAYMVWMHNTSLITYERNHSHATSTAPTAIGAHSR